VIDTHCHLTHTKMLSDRDELLTRARSVLSACISIGTGVEDAVAVRDLVREESGFVYGTGGLDPFTTHRLGAGFDEALRQLADLHSENELCAVGEIGLDYHYDLDPAAVQRKRFESQLALAAERNLPVVIHVREAHEDMTEVLAAHPEVRGVIHSFTGGPAEAEAYLALGWMLAFNGVATCRNAAEVREAATRTPADRILIETDSPYLAPVPKRGRRCEPAFVTHTLAALAETRGETVEKLEHDTDTNARRLFGLPGNTE
jgi:TatD DNase family protein